MNTLNSVTFAANVAATQAPKFGLTTPAQVFKTVSPPFTTPIELRRQSVDQGIVEAQDIVAKAKPANKAPTKSDDQQIISFTSGGKDYDLIVRETNQKRHSHGFVAISETARMFRGAESTVLCFGEPVASTQDVPTARAGKVATPLELHNPDEQRRQEMTAIFSELFSKLDIQIPAWLKQEIKRQPGLAVMA